MTKRSRLLLIAGVLGVVIILIALEYEKTEAHGSCDPIDAYEAANALIRKTLKDDEALVFPNYDASFVKVRNDVYTVSAHAQTDHSHYYTTVTFRCINKGLVNPEATIQYSVR